MKPSFFLPAAALFFSAALCLQSRAQTTNGIAERESRLAGRFAASVQSDAGTNYDVTHYRCDWSIDPAVRAIQQGLVTITFRVARDTASLFRFDFSSVLTVDSVRFNGVPAASGFSGTSVFWVKSAAVLTLGTMASVQIGYRGVPNNAGFGAFNRQLHQGVPIVWTMSCPYAAREWWPCKQDLRDKADSIDLIIRTPPAYRAAGNGILVSETTQNNRKVYHWKHRYPIATYLVATAVTNYTSFTHKVALASLNGDSLPVVNYVYPENAATATVQTRSVLPILQYYDSLVAPYPFAREKYGHAQFGWGGGMEHQTMSFMTDFSFGLQAHELAHQWFGNHITCGSWRDVWLNEGWATYMAALAERRFQISSFSSWLSSTQTSVRSSAGGSVWVSDTTSINRVFDSRLTYQKGALLLHMLRWQTGDSAFWAGVRAYQRDPARVYGFSGTPGFIAHLEQASGQDLGGFMQDWFYGQGFPVYQLILEKDGLTMRLKINQTPSHNSVSFFEMRVPVRFTAPGLDTTLVFRHDSSGQVFTFTLPVSPSSVSFDPARWILARATTQITTALAQPEAEEGRELGVYPNPSRDVLQIRNPFGSDVPVDLYSAQGQWLGRVEVGAGMELANPFPDLGPGVYWLRYSGNGRYRLRRVVRD